MKLNSNYLKKKFIWFLILGAVLLFIIFLTNSTVKKPLPFKKAFINGREFALENAINAPDQYRGLSFRTSLCEYCGMIFLFPDYSQRTFVMRNMGFSLDIIFIKNNTVKSIYENLPPEGLITENFYNSLHPIDKVLEINGGQAAKLELKIGDKIKFE